MRKYNKMTIVRITKFIIIEQNRQTMKPFFVFFLEFFYSLLRAMSIHHPFELDCWVVPTHFLTLRELLLENFVLATPVLGQLDLWMHSLPEKNAFNVFYNRNNKVLDNIISLPFLQFWQILWNVPIDTLKQIS